MTSLLVKRVSVCGVEATHYRADDPLWQDTDQLIRLVKEMGLVDGGSPYPRLRTRGWQVLVTLSVLAEKELEMREAEYAAAD